MLNFHDWGPQFRRHGFSSCNSIVAPQLPLPLMRIPTGRGGTVIKSGTFPPHPLEFLTPKLNHFIYNWSSESGFLYRWKLPTSQRKTDIQNGMK